MHTVASVKFRQDVVHQKLPGRIADSACRAAHCDRRLRACVCVRACVIWAHRCAAKTVQPTVMSFYGQICEA